MKEGESVRAKFRIASGRGSRKNIVSYKICSVQQNERKCKGGRWRGKRGEMGVNWEGLLDLKLFA